MAEYRDSLPHLSGAFFLLDGGLETTMVFHKGVELPHFSSIDMIRQPEGVALLREYYGQYAAIAQAAQVGFILDSPTWRASRGWAAPLGLTEVELAELNKRAIDLMAELRGEFETEHTPVVISGCVGTRGDGYSVDAMMSADEAADYHSWQIEILANAGADMIGALTLNYVEEAVGIANAAKSYEIPCVISFTVETDGRLPVGTALAEAIEAVDELTARSPAYYMINCAHLTHFQDVMKDDEQWVQRVRGIRGNASVKSHAELDESTELDDGDPVRFGDENASLLKRFPHINVVGGCCGTDTRHVEAICKARGA
jgi:S-methylmethionine-dependent homocysteine/selenocysteine methylase